MTGMTIAQRLKAQEAENQRLHIRREYVAEIARLEAENAELRQQVADLLADRLMVAVLLGYISKERAMELAST